MGMAETLVLLHGFAGTHRAWAGVLSRLDGERYRPIALDLRGHGAAAARRPISPGACVADVVAAVPSSFDLAGYSLGGRLALHVALAHPDRVRRLVLVSSSAGIEDPDERAARRHADAELAGRIEAGSIEEFCDRWRAQPLFAADPAHVDELARRDHRRNRPADLAAALRGLGAGVMEPVWDRLGELRMPVSVMAGERDVRYAALARRLARELPRGEAVIVPGAGHALALEAPEAVAAVLAGRDVTRVTCPVPRSSSPR